MHQLASRDAFPPPSAVSASPDTSIRLCHSNILSGKHSDWHCSSSPWR